MDRSVTFTVLPNSSFPSSPVIRESCGKIIFAIASTNTPTMMVYNVLAYCNAVPFCSPFGRREAKRLLMTKLIGCIHVLTMTGSISFPMRRSPSSRKRKSGRKW